MLNPEDTPIAIVKVIKKTWHGPGKAPVPVLNPPWISAIGEARELSPGLEHLRQPLFKKAAHSADETANKVLAESKKYLVLRNELLHH